ncbi:MAG: YraN family protein [Planctomycetota bacterium]|nr:YraN family protein [Planctomycetota bacterium]
MRFWFVRRSLGARGERLAERYLRRQGMRILHRGYRIMGGEIDLVAVDGRTVVFVEVKTRQTHDAGHPADAVDDRKQHQLTQLAMAYIKRYHLQNCSTRFDVVAITWGADTPKLEHYRNAFEASR